MAARVSYVIDSSNRHGWIRRAGVTRGLSAVTAAALLLLLLLLPGRADAGPWSKAAGAFYTKVGQTIFYSGSFVDTSGTVVDGVSNLSFTTAFYGEVGLYRGLQLALQLPITHGCNDFGNGNEWCRTSAGDLTAAMQYQLPGLARPLVLALRAEAKLPLYGHDNADPFERPAAGDAQLDFTFWLSGGASFGHLPLYAFAEIGYRHRTETFFGDTPAPGRQFNDGLVLATQIGYRLFDRLLVGAALAGVLPYSSNSVTKGYLTLGPFAYFPLVRGLAVEASVDPMLYAKASVRGVGATVGVSYQR